MLISLIFLSACSSNADTTFSKQVTITEATLENSKSLYSFATVIEGDLEAYASAKSPGVLENIYVNIGDYVNAGDLLASTEANVQSAQLNSANTAYQNAQSGLEKTKQLMDAQVKNAEIAIEIASQNAKASDTNLSNQNNINSAQLSSANLAVEQAELQLSNLQASFAQEEANLQSSLKSTVIQAAIFNKTLASYLYSINGEDLNTVTFEISPSFGASGQIRNDARNTIPEFKNHAFQLEDFYEANIKDQDPSLEALFEAQELAIKTTEKGKDAVQLMFELSIKSKNENSQFQTQLATYGTQAENLLLSQSDGKLTGLNGIKQNFETLNTNKTVQISSVEKQLEIAKEQAKLLQETTNASTDNNSSTLTISQSQLQQAEIALEAAKAQRESQVLAAKSQADLAKGQLDIAAASFENAQIRATFSGVITEKLVDQGNMLSAGTPVFKMISDTSFKAKISIPTSQISNFSVGQKAMVKVENIEEKLEASVVALSPASTGFSGKHWVELEIKGKKLISGSHADVVFDNENTEQQNIVIPFDSVFSQFDKSFVYIVENNAAKLTEIEIGQIYGNNVEVLSGLEKGDKVVISAESGLRDGDKVEVTVE